MTGIFIKRSYSDRGSHGRSHVTTDRNCRDSAVSQGMAGISSKQGARGEAWTDFPSESLEGTTF